MPKVEKKRPKGSVSLDRWIVRLKQSPRNWVKKPKPPMDVKLLNSWPDDDTTQVRDDRKKPPPRNNSDAENVKNESNVAKKDVPLEVIDLSSSSGDSSVAILNVKNESNVAKKDVSLEVIDLSSSSGDSSVAILHYLPVDEVTSVSHGALLQQRNPPVPPQQRNPPAAPLYSIEEFKGMWKSVEDDIGLTTEDIEDGKLVRGANSKIASHDSKNQQKAQYGRILPDAMQFLFKDVYKLLQSDIFIDIGHGIGNTVLQAAHTIGCEARGIEIVKDRNFIACVIQERLDELCKIHLERDGRETQVGIVKFRHGQLEVPEQQEFLTNPKGITKAFVNNFNGVFAERSAKSRQRYFLDNFVAGLFALMEPGSIMITLHPLDLGPTCFEAVEQRRLHHLTTGSERNTSFYEMEEVALGKAKDVVSWSKDGGNDKTIIVYKYTRLEQENGEAGPIFMCCNPGCTMAQSGEPIQAVTTIKVNGEERVIINYCECKETAKTLRRRKKQINYKEIAARSPKN